MKHTIVDSESVVVKLQNEDNLNSTEIITRNLPTTTTTTTTNLVDKDIKSIDLIEAKISNRISEIDHENCLPNDEDSFFICDLGEIEKSVSIWKNYLPNVQPHYAVKCNSNIQILQKLHGLGVNFDCASKAEIDLVLSLGYDSEQIIYANPCKTNSFIRHSEKQNVNLTTVDNVHELYKIQKFHPNCNILIRLITDDSTAQCQLSTKFGCDLNVAINEILPVAKKLDLNVYGVAFHVGSGAKDFTSIYQAIKDSRELFDKMYEFGFDPKILDIGGGFERETFADSAKMVNFALDKYFPAQFVQPRQIRFIAEPGRFMVANAFTLITHVIARRDLPQNSNNVNAMLYINDGVYGNLNCILFDHQNPRIYVLTNKNQLYYKQELTTTTANQGGYNFSVWGPTCDGLDCVSSFVKLSKDIQVGDWLFFENVGAYTSCASTKFNGLSTGETETLYVNSNE
ncbi:SPE1 Ornithine decarboxylase [Candida maltosa Xu316]|uniref:Ornithine decarboxylase n=1 Tax=Candida maltosa (strain Xu316) TaxID=1245528 RepID=M3HHH2_CANMX|nr:Ornithine decarboxylase [Candida maltosa Xu316]